MNEEETKSLAKLLTKNLEELPIEFETLEVARRMLNEVTSGEQIIEVFERLAPLVEPKIEVHIRQGILLLKEKFRN